MNNSSLTIKFHCKPREFLAPMTILFIAVGPLHVMVLIALVHDLRLQLSRHIIMLSLSISDGLQIAAFFITALISKVFSLVEGDVACFVTKKAILFTGIVTITTSSFTIVLLSVERYVACIHSFHIHEILSQKRVLFMLSLIWITGIGCALSSVFHQPIEIFHSKFGDEYLPGLLVSLAIMVSFPIIMIIQMRLLLFSRSKLMQVRPARAFGQTAELADYRKCQIKVTFVAGIVAVTFVVCMLPLSVMFLYESLNNVLVPVGIKRYFLLLTFLNNLADPIIYGFGVKDSRRCLLRRMRTIWNTLKWSHLQGR